MKLNITVTEDTAEETGAPPQSAAPARAATAMAPAAQQGANGALPVDAGAAPGGAAGVTGQPGQASLPGPATDGGQPPEWIADLVRRADAGQVPRPDAPADQGQEPAGTPRSGAPGSGPGATDAGGAPDLGA